MAQTDSAVLIPGTGAIWTGTVSSATEPTLTQLQTYASAGTVPSGWTTIGHTSIDNLPTPDQEEGETTTKGSWQKSSLDVIIETAAIDVIDIAALQVLDNSVLQFYYGGGVTTGTDRFEWPASPSPVQKAVTILYIMSATRVAALYLPKASLYRGGPLTVSRTEYLELPIRITRLDLTGAPPAVWIGDGLGV